MNTRPVSTGAVTVRTAAVLLKAIAAIVVAAVALSGLGSCQKSEGTEAGRGGGQKRPIAVNVVAATQCDVPIQVRTYGTVKAFKTVQIQAQVTDKLTKVKFQDGDRVRAGDILFTIDDRASQAALAQAKATLARDRVQYNNALAEARRQTGLRAKDIASKSDYENAIAAAEALAATTQADEAAIRAAQIQVEHCTITSPVDGVTRCVNQDAGNVVKANDTQLIEINQIRPVRVFFAIPQGEQFAVQNRENAKLVVEAQIPGAQTQPEFGVLTFVDRTVEKVSGTIQLAATFQNTHERLLPGRYVNVILTLGQRTRATVVPAQAVQTGRDGKFIMVVRPNMTVEIRPVTITLSTDQLAVIDAGVQPGERVVTDGYFQLKADSLVQIKGPAAATQPDRAAAGSSSQPGRLERSREAVP